MVNGPLCKEPKPLIGFHNAQILWPTHEISLTAARTSNVNLPSRAAAAIVMNPATSLTTSLPAEAKQPTVQKQVTISESVKPEPAKPPPPQITETYDQSPRVREKMRNTNPRSNRKEALQPSLSQQLASIANNSSLLIEANHHAYGRR